MALGSALTGAVIAVGSAIAYSRYAALYYDDGDSESGDYPVCLLYTSDAADE